MKKNYLNTTKYLISPELHTNLYESLYRERDLNSKIQKYIPGIHLINFRILNIKEKILVYNYVNYKSDFCESLMAYNLIRNDYVNINNKE